MKCPSKIKVGVHDYTVEFAPLLEDGAIGLCDVHTNSILIKSSLKGTMQAETILHEVLHAVYYIWGVKNSDGLHATEETAVNGLASGLSCVIRDNPKFTKYLMETLK